MKLELKLNKILKQWKIQISMNKTLQICVFNEFYKTDIRR